MPQEYHDFDGERVYSTPNGNDFNIIYEKRDGDEVLKKVVAEAYVKPDHIRIKDGNQTRDLELTWIVNGKMLVETIDDFLNDDRE